MLAPYFRALLVVVILADVLSSDILMSWKQREPEIGRGRKFPSWQRRGKGWVVRSSAEIYSEVDPTTPYPSFAKRGIFQIILFSQELLTVPFF